MQKKYDFAAEVQRRETPLYDTRSSVHAGTYVPAKAELIRRTPITPDELKRDAKFARLGIKPEHIAPENNADVLNQRFTHKSPLMFHITAFTINTGTCSALMIQCFAKYKDKVYIPNKNRLIVK